MYDQFHFSFVRKDPTDTKCICSFSALWSDLIGDIGSKQFTWPKDKEKLIKIEELLKELNELVGSTRWGKLNETSHR